MNVFEVNYRAPVDSAHDLFSPDDWARPAGREGPHSDDLSECGPSRQEKAGYVNYVLVVKWKMRYILSSVVGH